MGKFFKARKFPIILLLISLLPTFPVQVHANDFKSDDWTNEGVFSPLSAFNSYQWTTETNQNFNEKFTVWANGLNQSYYRLDEDSDSLFRGLSFGDILLNSTYDEHKIGFTYRDKDYRSEYDSYRVDVFAVYGSDTPFNKHLYVFGINEEQETVVLYADGEAIHDNTLTFNISQNDELKNLLFNTLILDNNSYTLTQWTEKKWYPEGALHAPESDTGNWEYYRETGTILYPKNTYILNNIAYYSDYTYAPIGTHPITGHDYLNDTNNTYYVTVPSNEEIYYDESEDEYYFDVPDEDGYTPRYHITKKNDPSLYVANQNKPSQADWSFKISDETYNRVRKKYFLLYGY